MMSHELAKILLENPDLPVATYIDRFERTINGTGGGLKVGIVRTVDGNNMVAIGNLPVRKAINKGERK